MRISEASDILTHILAYNRSAAAVVGEPGIGKSRMVRGLASPENTRNFVREGSLNTMGETSTFNYLHSY